MEIFHDAGTDSNVSSDHTVPVDIEDTMDQCRLAKVSGISIENEYKNPVVDGIVYDIRTPRSSTTDDLTCITSNETCCIFPEVDNFITKDPMFRSYLGKFSGTYNPVRFEPDLDIFPEFFYHTHYIGGLPSQLNASAWLSELAYENDSWLKSYIKRGVIEGFDIVDNVHLVDPYDRSNYSSVQREPANDFVNNLILDELAEGKYIYALQRPKCVHSLGVVPKSGGGFRPITNCRQPFGFSINNFMEQTAQEFKYHTVDHVQEMFFPNYFSSTIDIAAAY